MLRAFGQLLHNISQHDPTMLQDVALKCYVVMLRAFDRALSSKQIATPINKYFHLIFFKYQRACIKMDSDKTCNDQI